MIIQDKTFVPQNVAVQDSKWDLTKWGQPGDLWFPHVYEPNQNPNSPDGTNPFGRWDYGPWFWPPVIVAADHSTLPDPSTTPDSSASVSYQVVAPSIPTGVTITPTVMNPLKTRPVLFTASGPGTSGYRYRFWMNRTLVQDYGVGSSWTMPANTKPGTYLIEVDARVGTSATPTASASLQYTVSGPVSVSHDFNNDGMAGIVWRHAGSGQVEIWNMNGTTNASQGSPATISDLNWDIK